VPFCLQKCNYCDFVSYDNALGCADAYVDALLTELSQYRGEAVSTVYIGGGTPTAIGKRNLTKILDGVFSTFSVDRQPEVTVECNPSSADKDTFLCLLEHGANRVSIGVQSLDDRVLSAIGRRHSAYEARMCVENAIQAGFENISTDLMYGLPHQTRNSLLSDIRTLGEYDEVVHMSCYGLTLSERVPLYTAVQNGEVTVATDDEQAELYDAVYEELADYDYLRYEVSNFAQEGGESKHNLGYWQAEEYFGCGVAAHAYVDGQRFSHTTDLLEYIKNPTEKKDVITLSREDKIKEYIMLNLRLRWGISTKKFYEKFGERFEIRYHDVLKKNFDLGLMKAYYDYISLTERAFYVSNPIISEFM